MFSMKRNMPCRVFSAFLVFVISVSLIVTPNASYAQSLLNLPVPGTMVMPTDAYVPVMLKGLTIHPEDPLKFDFIVDTGNSDIEQDKLPDESSKLIKYFLASLTVPQDELWVNLSPYEKDRTIPESLGKTELGQDLLAQDYLLKQLTASLMYPEDELGREFWDAIYQKTQAKYGTTDIPIDTFNKVWIIPESASVYEHEQTVYVVNSKLKVLLEQDYLALSQSKKTTTKPKEDAIATEIIREIIIPEIEKEVNEGENFAPLRQIYQSLILAKWYKETLKDSLLSKVYVDQNKMEGIHNDDPEVKEKIYAQYMQAYKKGVYDYMREDYDTVRQEIIPRKYFSGGFKSVDFALATEKPSVDMAGGKNFKVAVELEGRSAQEDTAIATEITIGLVVAGLVGIFAMKNKQPYNWEEDEGSPDGNGEYIPMSAEEEEAAMLHEMMWGGTAPSRRWKKHMKDDTDSAMSTQHQPVGALSSIAGSKNFKVAIELEGKGQKGEEDSAMLVEGALGLIIAGLIGINFVIPDRSKPWTDEWMVRKYVEKGTNVETVIPIVKKEEKFISILLGYLDNSFIPVKKRALRLLLEVDDVNVAPYLFKFLNYSDVSSSVLDKLKDFDDRKVAKQLLDYLIDQESGKHFRVLSSEVKESIISLLIYFDLKFEAHDRQRLVKVLESATGDYSLRMRKTAIRYLESLNLSTISVWEKMLYYPDSSEEAIHYFTQQAKNGKKEAVKVVVGILKSQDLRTYRLKYSLLGILAETPEYLWQELGLSDTLDVIGFPQQKDIRDYISKVKSCSEKEFKIYICQSCRNFAPLFKQRNERALPLFFKLLYYEKLDLSDDIFTQMGVSDLIEMMDAISSMGGKRIMDKLYGSRADVKEHFGRYFLEAFIMILNGYQPKFLIDSSEIIDAAQNGGVQYTPPPILRQGRMLGIDWEDLKLFSQMDMILTKQETAEDLDVDKVSRKSKGGSVNLPFDSALATQFNPLGALSSSVGDIKKHGVFDAQRIEEDQAMISDILKWAYLNPYLTEIIISSAIGGAMGIFNEDEELSTLPFQWAIIGTVAFGVYPTFFTFIGAMMNQCILLHLPSGYYPLLVSAYVFPFLYLLFSGIPSPSSIKYKRQNAKRLRFERASERLSDSSKYTEKQLLKSIKLIGSVSEKKEGDIDSLILLGRDGSDAIKAAVSKVLTSDDYLSRIPDCSDGVFDEIIRYFEKNVDNRFIRQLIMRYPDPQEKKNRTLFDKLNVTDEMYVDAYISKILSTSSTRIFRTYFDYLRKFELTQEKAKRIIAIYEDLRTQMPSGYKHDDKLLEFLPEAIRLRRKGYNFKIVYSPERVEYKDIHTTESSSYWVWTSTALFPSEENGSLEQALSDIEKRFQWEYHTNDVHASFLRDDGSEYIPNSDAHYDTSANNYKFIATVDIKNARIVTSSEKVEIVQGEKLTDDAMPTQKAPGGIDMNEINVERQGDGADIKFDPKAIDETLMNVEGFAPVIINITPIQSIYPLLGLAIPDQETPKEDISSALPYGDDPQDRLTLM